MQQIKERIKGIRKNTRSGGYDPSEEGCEWFLEVFKDYPDDLPIPYIYPTPDSNLQVEWPIGVYEISLEIDLKNKTGNFHLMNMSTQEYDDFDVDLNLGLETITKYIRLAMQGDLGITLQ